MKKGFTLVELLAVISILAVLAMIAVVSINKTIINSQNKLYNTQINSIKQAAKTYYLKEGMASNINCVDVSSLIEKGYIEGKSVIDTRTGEPISGSIRIKYNSNQYSYEYKTEPCLFCTIDRQISSKYTVGDVVTCGSEQFYVIENQDTDTTEGIDMLAMYNLTLTESPIQDTTGATNPIAFSSSNYWYDTTNKVFTVDANYASEGRSYPYVYRSYIVDGEEQNNMYPYVEAYRDMLEGMQVNIIDAKLMSYEQIIEFGCEELEYCTSAYSWLYSTSYWTGSSVGPDFEEAVWPMFSGGYFHDSTFNDDESFGIRPLITIPTYVIK